MTKPSLLLPESTLVLTKERKINKGMYYISYNSFRPVLRLIEQLHIQNRVMRYFDFNLILESSKQ